MREIDTDVLAGVAGSLGVGNPATATAQVVFDDDNLQQMWDASKFARFPRLTAVAGFSCNAAAGLTNRETATRSELFLQTPYRVLLEQLNLTPDNADVYLVGFNALADLSQSGNLDEYQMGVAAAQPNAVAADVVRLAFGTSVDGTLDLVGTGDLVGIQNNIELIDDCPHMLPMKLVSGTGAADPEVLFMLCDAGAGGQAVTKTLFKLHFCRKGMPIWYDMSAG